MNRKVKNNLTRYDHRRK